DGLKDYRFYGVYSVDYYLEVGQPLGVYKVPQVETVKSGPNFGKVVVQANGIPKTNLVDKKTVGNSNPDFELGFSNNFSYKNLSLSALVDWRKGGHFYSYTSQLMNFVGNSTETTFNYRQP